MTQTVVDTYGNLSTVSHPIAVTAVPAASFVASTAKAPAGSAIQFNGTGSNEPGGSISSYSWSFGDGSRGHGCDRQPCLRQGRFLRGDAHWWPTARGATASMTLPVSVSGVPTAEMAIVAGHPVADVPFAFEGTRSTDSGSTLTGYSWSFGDGGTATGA